ncbi:MFS transporter [Rhizosaccharibacter radicis]|uniref:MFS transporter n=1 Tax=Rhizosaccharibacter radicis TaxID=2782605 RepID=A0ABT1VY16_9PROT|nr:MFS transporter [Acetobacteraceae bacterium KSS12]
MRQQDQGELSFGAGPVEPPAEFQPREDALTREHLRILFLSSLGGVLEFYDFVIFVFLARTIGFLFFPADEPEWLRDVQAFGLFAAGYLARPLGGIIMAHYGDRDGRKRVFTFSVLLMAVPTLLIGLMPTYAVLGVAAPMLLLLMRVLQGAAIGGEAPGGWVFVAEHAPPGRQGTALGLLTAGLTGGILLGSVVATLTTILAGEPALRAWAWRVPFLLGGVFGLGAMVLRRWLRETPVFAALRNQHRLASDGAPAVRVLREHRRGMLTSMSCTWMLTAAIVVVILMTPTLLPRLSGVTPANAQRSILLASLFLTLSAMTVGVAVDRWGPRRVGSVLIPLFVLATYDLFGDLSGWPLPLRAVLAGTGAGLVSLVPVAMVRCFPPAVRFSGLSLSYNLAYAVCGGVTPPLVAWLATLGRFHPAHYVAVACAAGLSSLLFSRLPAAVPASSSPAP